MRRRVLVVLTLLTGATGAWFLTGAGPGFPLDDAWMHMVYARALASGEGLAFNPGGPPEAGITAPLWTALAAAVEWICRLVSTSRVDIGMRILGGLAGLATAWVAFRLNSRAGRWPAVFSAGLLLVDPLNMYGRFSGMEVPLFGLLSLLFIEALLDGRETRAGWIGGLLLLTRPEGLALIAFGVVHLLIRRRPAWRAVWPAFLLAAPWIAYCLWVTGRPFANTLVTKAAWNLDPLEVAPAALALLRDTGYGWALPLLLLAGTISLEGGSRLLGRVQLLAGLVLLAGVVATRPLPLFPVGADEQLVPFYWQRHVLLAWPLLLSVAAAGIGSLVRTAYAAIFCRPGAALALMGPLLVMLVCARFLPAHAFELRNRFAAQCRQVEEQNVAAGRWIDAHMPAGALVATHDTGAVRYFGRRPVLDIYGNNHTPLARLIWDDDVAGAVALLGSARPDALVAFPLQYAVNQSGPEWQRLGVQYRDRPDVLEAVAAYVQATGDAFASGWGLTRRAITFHVDVSVTVDSPIHEDLAIFVRP